MNFYYQIVEEGKVISSVKSKNPLNHQEIIKFSCEIGNLDCDLARVLPLEIIEQCAANAKWFIWDDYESGHEECHRCITRG